MHKRSKGFSLAEFLLIVAILAVLVWVFMPLFKDSIIRTRSVVDSSNIRNAYGDLVREVQASEDTKSTWVELRSKPAENKRISIAVFGTIKDPDSGFYSRNINNNDTLLLPFAQSDAVKYVKITAYSELTTKEDGKLTTTVTVSYEPVEKIEKK